MDILKIVNQQNTFFNSNITKEIGFRIETLKKLKHLLKENEDKLYTAIYSDFKKSEFETYLTEISLIYNEINDSINNLKEILSAFSIQILQYILSLPNRLTKYFYKYH